MSGSTRRLSGELSRLEASTPGIAGRASGLFVRYVDHGVLQLRWMDAELAFAATREAMRAGAEKLQKILVLKESIEAITLLSALKFSLPSLPPSAPALLGMSLTVGGDGVMMGTRLVVSAEWVEMMRHLVPGDGVKGFETRGLSENELPQAGAEEASVEPQAAASKEPIKEKTPRVDFRRVAQEDVRLRRVEDANDKNPIRFSLHRRVFRLSRRSSALRVAAQPGDPCPPQQRPSGERDGPACLESEVEGVPGPGRRGAAEQGRQAAAGGSPQRLVGKKDRPRGRIMQPGAKGRGGRPGGGP
ncbi:hypothetical protein [Archangium violaceum]|uniref:hypothetical protein n=1 Tax=Archangium violaceum TaxID=83451 RepID=UPI0037BFE526